MLPRLLWSTALAAVASHAITWDAGFNFGTTTVRGVSIGGWLVLEPWITPSIFDAIDNPDVVDEYTLTKTVDNASDILTAHWNTWATEADFIKLAAAGINTVRIPIGYWAYKLFDNDPYIQGADAYLEKAIGWAKDAGLWVWVDLHGAPGSQNGYDNSGQKTSTPEWGTGDTVSETLEVLQIIVNKYSTAEYSGVVAGIELLNEPALYALSVGQSTLEGYYQEGYEMVRNVTNTANIGVLLHDGFVLPSKWDDFLSADEGYQNVVVDHHEYQAFSNEYVAWTINEHLDNVCSNAANYTANRDKWLVVGEWCGAMTDCAKYLNGYDVGARYDGTYPDSTYVGSCDTARDLASWDATFRANTRAYIETQLDVYEQNAQGWVFWNFKTENSSAPEWDFLALVEAGIFPQPLGSRMYTSICSV